MLYPILKAWVALSLKFFARKIRVINDEALNFEGPLLLACTHPNSFLDALLIGTHFKHPSYFMTRGDVFNKPFVRKLLSKVNMIPIYRMREGKDNLSLNDQTFDTSVRILREDQILLIFVEGVCEHQTTLLQPLKKGAPRIVQACWQQGIPVKILPVWLQYSSFDRFGKTIEIRFGERFGSEIAEEIGHPATINKINAITSEQLLHLSNHYSFREWKPGIALRILLLIPAMLGAILHAPLYLPLQAFTKKVSTGNVHYDSILVGLLTFLYPLYLVIITAILLIATQQWWPLLTLLVMPLLAQAYLHWKK